MDLSMASPSCNQNTHDGGAPPARFLLWHLAGALVFLLGCSMPAGLSRSPAPTPTTLPLYQQVVLGSRSSTETGQPYAYTIRLETPELTGSDDPRVQAFNSEMAAIVTSAASEFKSNLLNVPPTPVSAASTFAVHYSLLMPLGRLISLQFVMDGYVTGAAHPSRTSRSVNFDLGAGHDLALADLFKPGSSFLQLISDYSVAQLATRGIDSADFAAGAAPTADNYRNWNVTPAGIQITFDEYQVAAYALGPQTVLVPYDQLRPMIEDPGPLTPYLH